MIGAAGGADQEARVNLGRVDARVAKAPGEDTPRGIARRFGGQPLKRQPGPPW